MSNHKYRKILQPQYVSDFYCIGPTCDDNCCKGWRVDIDKDTYMRYREGPDNELHNELKERIARRRSATNDFCYAIMDLKDGWCAFIDEDKYCSIQRKLGEGYLSVTCTSYPRITNIVNGVTEKCLTMSCPEAAKLALLNLEPMSFDETVEDNAIRYNSGKVLNTHGYKENFLPQKYFWELRIFIIFLLQNRSLQLWERLIVLGLFCRHLDQLKYDNKIAEIPLLIGNYMNKLDSPDYLGELNSIPNEIMIQMGLMKEITEERIFTGGVNKRFLECYNEFLLGIQYTRESTKEKIGENYLKSYNGWYKPFMEKHSYILENYLINYVFKNLFPFTGEKLFFDDYVKLVVHYAMIKMILIGMAGFHKEKLNIDQVMKLIQSFSKTIEHHDIYLKKVIKLMKDNKFNTMPYMAILIKN